MLVWKAPDKPLQIKIQTTFSSKLPKYACKMTCVPAFYGGWLNLHLHMQMPGSANRSVNCKYKAATEDIFTSPVKARTVVWTTNEIHAVGSARIIWETGNDCLLAEID